MTKETRDDIPLGYTYDDNGKVLTHKNSTGDWYEYTRDDNGNVLTFKSSNGYWSEYTRDDNGRELTFKDSNGYWCEYTYDDNGKVLTHKNSTGDWFEHTYDDNGKVLTYKKSTINGGELFARVAEDPISPHSYNLFTNEAKDFFVAGCREFTKAEALEHWGNPRDDNAERAKVFLDVISKL